MAIYIKAYLPLRVGFCSSKHVCWTEGIARYILDWQPELMTALDGCINEWAIQAKAVGFTSVGLLA